MFKASINLLECMKLNQSSCDGKRNVILITVDCMRADKVGENITPHISAFSKDSLVFTQAISQGASTRYSFMSLFTSKYCTEVLSSKNNVADFSTLPEALKNSGFSTAAFIGSNPQLMSWEKYFDTWYNGDLDGDYSKLDKIRGKLIRVLRYIFYNALSPNADDLNQKVKKWLNNRNEDNFFLWVHYMDVHTPRMPPKKFTPTIGWLEKRAVLLHQLRRKFFDGLGVSARFCSVEKRVYDASVKSIDWEIAKLIKTLKNEDIYENSIIILTADHGEEFDHNKCVGLPHARMYDEIIKVPLIIKIPSWEKNLEVDKVVRLIDVMPTILDLQGIEDVTSCSGSSLLTSPLKDRVAFSYCKASPTTAYACIRNARYKLINKFSTNQEVSSEFFDLISDPEELNNIKKSEVKTEMEERLSTHLSLTQNITLSSADKEENYNEKIKDRLKVLGYID